uniref:Uncharacterized protein n=1 Tax=Rhizophagus irregularis (strain DAOM 181602 / DAOM 197198 / MUCL 43194) TaxID=747089 RepID=U9T6X0_RHIID
MNQTHFQIMDLQLVSLPRKESRWILNDIDVSEKWHLFKEKSLELANGEGLFVESHTQQILSLSHVLLLKPKQHCPLMLEVLVRICDHAQGHNKEIHQARIRI